MGSCHRPGRRLNCLHLGLSIALLFRLRLAPIPTPLTLVQRVIAMCSSYPGISLDLSRCLVSGRRQRALGPRHSSRQRRHCTLYGLPSALTYCTTSWPRHRLRQWHSRLVLVPTDALACTGISSLLVLPVSCILSLLFQSQFASHHTVLSCECCKPACDWKTTSTPAHLLYDSTCVSSHY